MKIKIQWTDKEWHKLAGTLIVLVVGLILSIFINVWLAGIIAFGTSVLIGWLKEWYWDKKLGKGQYDLEDFFATVWGGLVGIIIFVILIDKIY